ncbi:MAG: metal-dependent transcriptional regulator [Anaerolineaceae bacterium]|jgi:Mn-dependent DtxR family transcriptional regulator|nr:metal-dependent transcriptional regulator [Anaerolineaceae bacterium]
MNVQESAEMYLKTILILEKRIGIVRAIDIAREMQFSRPTVSQQIKNLTANGYLEVDNKKQIFLSPKGREIAEETYYRHNGLVDFFIWIGVSEDTALEDACRIEHYISQETFDRMREYFDKCRNLKGGDN